MRSLKKNILDVHRKPRNKSFYDPNRESRFRKLSSAQAIAGDLYNNNTY